PGCTSRPAGRMRQRRLLHFRISFAGTLTRGRMPRAERRLRSRGMSAESWHIGRAAAPGLAYGPLFRLPATDAPQRQRGSAAEETAALRAAIAAAIAEIEKLQLSA